MMPEVDPNLEFTPPTQKELELTERVAQLEQKLDDALLMLSDIYRYRRLKDLLSEGKFKEADGETTQVMLEVEGKTSQEELTPANITTYPTHVLQVIDQLWRRYSSDRFGFSLQLNIYQEGGGTFQSTIESDFQVLSQAAFKFGWKDDPDKFGLRDYDAMDFSLSAPKGAFPMQWWISPYGTKSANFFLARLMECQF